MTDLGYPIFDFERVKPKKQYWDHDNITEQKFRLEQSRSSTFAKCFNHRYNLSQDFINDIKNRTAGEHPNSIVIQIFGEQGFGKSVLAMKIAKIIDPSFNAKKIFFRVEDLFSYCHNVKPNECLVLDEQTIQFGEGSQRQMKDLQNIEEVTRIKSVHFIFCSPTLRKHLACHYTLKVIQRNKEDRLTKFAFCTQGGKAYLGYGTAKIPKDEDNPIFQEYLIPKLEFALKTLRREGEKYNVFAFAEDVRKNPKITPNLKQKEVKLIIRQMWPTFVVAEIDNICTAYFMSLKKG